MPVGWGQGEAMCTKPCCWVLVVVVFSGCGQPNEDHDATNRRIEALELQVATLETRVDALESPNAQEPATTAVQDPHYVLGDGVISDTRSGLVWEAVTLQQRVTIDEGRRHCEELRAGGFEDWRLPSQPELMSLLERELQPMISELFLPLPSGTPTLPFMSSRPGRGRQIHAVSFADGTLWWGGAYMDGRRTFVRCVRGGGDAADAGVASDEGDAGTLPVSQPLAEAANWAAYAGPWSGGANGCRDSIVIASTPDERGRLVTGRMTGCDDPVSYSAREFENVGTEWRTRIGPSTTLHIDPSRATDRQVWLTAYGYSIVLHRVAP